MEEVGRQLAQPAISCLRRPKSISLLLLTLKTPTFLLMAIYNRC
jgi:hypothetical protein